MSPPVKVSNEPFGFHRAACRRNGKKSYDLVMSEAPTRTPAAFPSTIWSEIIALQVVDLDGRRERLQRLIERYWRPVYWAIRCDKRFSEEEVRDLTQEFFVLILEGQVIPGVDPQLGSFRRHL